MRNRACGAGSLGATQCTQRTCGPSCQASRTVLRSAASVPQMFQNDKGHNVATTLRETHNRNRQTYSHGRSPHNPLLCKCGNCSRGHLPETSFKHLLYRQNVGVGEGAARLHSVQSHSHSQQNRCDPHCCGSGPSFYQGKQSADNLIERWRLTPKSSVCSASGAFEQRNASVFAGCMSHVPFPTKTSELRSSSLDTTSKLDFQYPEKAPPGALKKQISLHGWYLMKPTVGDSTTGCLSGPGVTVGGFRSPKMLRTEFVQTTRVEQRLERSKLRTSDGLEVSLVGMIDQPKSIANGFSPALVKYFLIGFPSTWIDMMRNLNIKGSMPDLPSSSVLQDMDNFAGQSQELSVAANPVLRTLPAPLFTPPSEGTWKEALRSSPTTLNSLHPGASDINMTQQCDLDQEQSEGQKNCPRGHLGAGREAENSGLQRKTSSMMKDCPRSDPEAIAVENTDKVPDGSSQTGKRPVLQGDRVGETGEDPESTSSQKSVVIKDVPGLTPVNTLVEDVHEVPECSSQAQETQAVSDYPNSVVKVKACCEGPQYIATEEGTAVVDGGEDSTVYTEDFSVDHEDETELPSVQVPFTPLPTSRQLMSDSNKHSTDKSTRGVGTDPVKSLQNLYTGRKLRSGKCLLVVDKHIREQSIVREDAVENTKTRKRLRNPKTLTSEGCKNVMLSRELISSTEDRLVHHEDACELGGLDQLPSTPSQKITKRLKMSPGSTIAFDTPTTEAEIHPVSNLPNADDRKKLRSGRYLRALDKPIQELVANPVNTPQTPKTRNRRKISLSAAPVGKCEDVHSIERDGPPSNAIIMEERDTKDYLHGHEGDSEVSSRPTDEFCEESAGVDRPVIKKRHRKVSKLYGSQRKKSCPDSFPTRKPKLESSGSDSCNGQKKNVTVGVDKTLQKEDPYPTPRKNSTKVHQFSNTTGRVELNRETSRCTSQAEKEVQTGKRNSIVPPPLPTPRVADKDKVIEAYGLKRSRFGRILVPPLAVWRNQSIIYDADGSIIAISDASSSEGESQTGGFNFTFPSDTGARKMQKKLLKTAHMNWSQK